MAKDSRSRKVKYATKNFSHRPARFALRSGYDLFFPNDCQIKIVRLNKTTATIQFAYPKQGRCGHRWHITTNHSDKAHYIGVTFERYGAM